MTRLPAALAASILWAGLTTGAPAHPLDPLSADEIHTAVAVLRDAGDVDADTRFALIDLDEPDKREVLAWQAGQPFPRRAFIVARRDRMVYEAVIDLAARKVERWEAIPGVQPAIGREEWKEAQRVTLADAGWRAAMNQRGYDDFSGDKLFCAPLSAGYFADPAEEGRRLVRVTCFDKTGTINVWSRPIEGLLAIVNLDEKKVIRLVDTGAVPRSAATSMISKERRQNGASPAASNHGFSRDGSEVRWKNWSLHYRLDERAGLILSLVRYRDQDRERLILYRGSIGVDVRALYGPGPGLVVSDLYGCRRIRFRPLGSHLAPGIDCPATAAFLDAVLPSDRGEPLAGKSVICLFERATDAPLWRHAESDNGAYAGRPAVELVLQDDRERRQLRLPRSTGC